MSTYSFPGDWLGDWKGELRIFSQEGHQMDMTMELHIHESDSAGVYEWTIQYGEGEDRDERAYLLREKNKELGQYLIDEQNNIVLETYLLGNILYSRFEVSKALIMSSYRMQDGHIHFELISGGVGEPFKTGGVGEIPDIFTYPVKNMQEAILYKQQP